jgi:hypothetical protein
MQKISLCLLAAALLVALPAERLSAQTATWYLVSYTNDVFVWDEATEQLVDRITMRNFIPAQVTLNEAETRLYVQDATLENVEVVDLSSRRVIDEFTLSHDSIWVRIDEFQPHPDGRRAVIHAKRYTKMRDRYSVEGPFLLEYDMVAKQVTDTIAWPDGEERERVRFEYSPDGKTLYFFLEEIVALDADTYQEISRWEMAAPLEPGLGRANYPTGRGTWDEEGVATGLYRMTDPVQNRSMMGIARVRLTDEQVDFFTLGPSEPVNQFALAPGGHKAYALYSTVGRYEFWEFDLDAHRVTRRQPFAGRPRMSLRVSADGERLFVYGAGPTIDVYDADTFELLRTVEFDADIGMSSVVIPAVG